MKTIVTAAFAAMLLSGAAMAGTKVITGNPGPTTINASNTKVINQTTITGGTSTGLKVKGTNNTVINNGTITGKIGLSVTGGSSSIVNNGTISASSTSKSTSVSVGVSAGN